jgi:hypothetical protein
VAYGDWSKKFGVSAEALKAAVAAAGTSASAVEIYPEEKWEQQLTRKLVVTSRALLTGSLARRGARLIQHCSKSTALGGRG